MRARNKDQKLLATLQAPVRKLQKDYAHDNHVAPVASVRQPAERQTHQAIKQSKRDALQQSDPGIADGEVTLHRPNQQAKNLPIDKGQRVTNHQNKYYVPSVPKAWLVFCRS
jgi:hypothetical protein